MVEGKLTNQLLQSEQDIKNVVGGIKVEPTGEWKIPFLIVVLIVFGAGIAIYRVYQNLLKKHIL